MQHAQTWLHAHLHVPSKCRLSLIPVDSGCTVTNIDHGSIIHADHRMSASRPICVASKNSDAIYPDYEGYGQIMTFSNFGQIKKPTKSHRCSQFPSQSQKPMQEIQTYDSSEVFPYKEVLISIISC